MRTRGRRVGETPAWWTGTIEDEFTPVYMGMAQHTVLHGPLPPSEVDRMDLVTLWALQGVVQQERLLAQATSAYQGRTPERVMTPLTAEEKAERFEQRRRARQGPTTAG